VSALEFSKNDLEQIELRGIPLATVMSQIEILRKGPPCLRLNRPCTIGDGIKSISEEEAARLASVFEAMGPKRGLTGFVPASGAASRMFRILLGLNPENKQIHRDSIALQARKGDKNSQYLLTFMDGIQKLAFYEDLVSVMAQDGLDARALAHRGQFKEIVDYLLRAKGLNYAHLPKGLLKFHKYPEGTRTAFQEHLVEATDYLKDHHGACHIHFTVSVEHRERFKVFWKTISSRYENDLGVRFHLSFSVQERSTDTIAVDQENKPFRLNDGTLFFRAGGHGALIANLNNLKGDIVFVKNIDNVVPDRLKGHTSFWKKVLGGCLIQLQQRIFSYLERLSAGPADKELLEEGFDFAKQELCLWVPWDRDSTPPGAGQELLVSMLNRPFRVCGVVRNQGEPGGGPFWVEASDGSLSLQIVESAEVDPLSQEQQRIQASSTHFNPVDIVCGVRDFNNNAFDLKRYVNTDAVFISQKSRDGRELKALELPGLWNGAMAYWNTVFVEVPAITFNPVKTLNDLLRKEHQ
jgi:hypothetical protein